MKYTLLEAVQLILSAMDSDEVDSYDQTPESLQVALLLKSVFYDVSTEVGLPQHETLLELTASGDSSKPTIMTLPSNVVKLNWVKYDNIGSGETTSNYLPVYYMTFHDFLERQQGVRDNDNAVEVVISQNGEEFNIYCTNDKPPSYYTQTDDNQLIFDSYDAAVDTTLQKSKVLCHGWVYPTWTMSDDFVPDLEPAQFAYFINKAKARAFYEIKQQVNQEAAGEARRQKITLQKKKFALPLEAAIMQAPRYGRK